MSSPILILASRSPRRAQLLTEAGYLFIQADPPFADPPEPVQVGGTVDAQEVAKDLACRKALSLRETGILAAHPLGTILAADTICVGSDDQLLGQPPDRAAAKAMIQRFVGQTHLVVTGIALLSAKDAQPQAYADTGIVTMGAISGHQIDEYVNSDHWRGKAGGYNLFERQRAGWPITVVGDPCTIVGLPMRLLPRLLAQYGLHATLPPVTPGNPGPLGSPGNPGNKHESI